MPPEQDSIRVWESMGYFQTFYCTEESKGKAKKLVYQYFLQNEPDPSNCNVRFNRVSWMSNISNVDDLAKVKESGLAQEMFANRDKIGIWFAGEKSYYRGEKDYDAEVVKESIEEFDLNDEIEAELSEFDDVFWNGYDGQCQACDDYGPVDEMMLCNECAGKLERDLIRQREWDYSVSAFAVSDDGREKLRDQVIKKYGAKLELIAAKSEKKTRKNRNKPKGKRKRK